MSTARRWVYYFGNGRADGKGDQKELLGGKGAGLAEMTRIGLPVPGGFTITTEACAAYNKRGKKWPAGLEKEVRTNLTRLERESKKKLGAARDPLLVSVRSGAAKSMPGMMETILNLGLNDQSVEGLAEVASDKRFAYDAYRRLIMMYGATAKGIDKDHFEDAFTELKDTGTRHRLGLGPSDRVRDTDVSADELADLVEQFKSIYRRRCDEDFPQDPFIQLKGAIDAVFDSWMADKAVTYRRVEKITGLNGTAVNLNRMVFGNMGDDCGTGVCFTRDPSTGQCTFYGDMLINAQGEDVVAGVRTPLRLAELEKLMPEIYDQLEAVRAILELHYKDMQDLEFTIERHKLYILQTRSGKRSPVAAFKIAVDQATTGLMPASLARRLAKKKYLPKKLTAAAVKPIITKEQAIQRVQAVDIERLFYPVVDPQVSASELARRKIGEGIGAVPGAACGEVVFTAGEAETRAASGASVILVRKETSPEDVGGMHAAVGVLTATGGKTSHAAVVARGWGKCCIVGCETLSINYDAKQMSLNGTTIREGEPLTLDGSTGGIFQGRLELTRPTPPPEYDTLMGWCDRKRRMRVRANADTPADAARAVELGAEGIGLCRTEHMFFDSSQPERLTAMREMILARSEADRRRALDRLLPFQRSDFEGVFEAMNGKPVTIRLLDPPLHEFLPQHDNPEGQRSVVDALNEPIRAELMSIPESDGQRRRELEGRLVDLEDIRRRVDQLHEVNPMLGHRGCRLCITYPEILEMQVRAIMEAAVNCAERGIKVHPEIMIPLSIDSKELSILIERTRAVADAILAEPRAAASPPRGGRKSRADSTNKPKIRLTYMVGTMIETPRAAITAAKMAETAEFFSFGTNDLTQLTMGLSRDDAGRFLPDYVDQNKSGIFAEDPFQSIDTDGVGFLVASAFRAGRAARPKLKVGICGEHGGDPASIRFCEQVGLDYVSCSPPRIPIARLAAAQAVIETKGKSSRKTAMVKRHKPKAKTAAPKVRSAKKTAKKKAKKTASRKKSKTRR